MKRRGKLGEEESKRKEGSWMIFPVDVHAFLYEQFRVISFIYNRGGGNFKSDAKHELEIFSGRRDNRIFCNTRGKLKLRSQEG